MRQLLPESISKWMFMFTVIISYLVVNLGFFYFFTFRFNLWTLVYAVLLEYMVSGLVYDFAELLFVLLMPQCNALRNGRLTNYPRVALLCCTCDDVDVDVLKNLHSQTYPNLGVFILDDSRSNECRSLVDSLNLKVIRRHSRVGYKAGNLNNWLSQYGSSYPYFVVADADSILPDNFVEQMVCYAEHPENANVAIFESLIQAWNIGNKFARQQNVMTPLYHRLKLQLDNRLDTNLSVGHNNLYRTDVIKNVGGFLEDYLAEDFATSAEILKSGKWLCKTVPVVSYERLPQNVSEYSRRQARWAFQTFQLLGFNTSGLSINLRLKLLRVLHHHAAPVVALIGMSFLALSSLNLGGFSPSLNLNEYKELFIRSNVFRFWIVLLVAPLVIRGFLICRKGVSIKDYVISTLFHSALFVATMWPVIRRLTALLTGDRIGFNVTGTSPQPSLLQIISLGWMGFGLVWVTLVIVLFHPFMSVLNLLWILPAAVSPLVIYYFQRTTT